MEFHILSTKRCRVEQTETNFKLIKDSLNQLREDLHEAEINFHRKSLGNEADDDDRDQPDQFASSVSLLEHCEHPWTEEPEYAEVNKSALQYYEKRNKDGPSDGPDLRRKDKKIRKQRTTPQQNFLKDLSKMWIAGANPPELGPGTYNPQRVLAIKPTDPSRQSAAFNNRKCRSDLTFMGDNNTTLRPRYSNAETEEDEIKLTPKLPAWKTFNAYQNSIALNESKSKSMPELTLTSEDAPQYIFPKVPPTHTASSTFSFSHVPRFLESFRAEELKLRPILGANGSTNNLGSTYRASWDDKIRFAKGHKFSKSRRTAPM